VDLYATRRARAALLIGVDDTDNLESRGTGRLVQELIGMLPELGLGEPLGATRHQLFVDDRIPYTSHNSSACIALDIGPAGSCGGEAVARAVGAFLERESAPGSDPGLAVAVPTAAAAVSAFGARAKREVLTHGEARRLAGEVGIHISAHGGDGGGIIGALAAVGLHAGGDDGRFLWLPGLRALEGTATYDDLRRRVPIDAACDAGGREPAGSETIELGTWVRPVLIGGRTILLLEPDGGRWRVAPKAVVKSH
jgi:hypothetical protein